MITKYSHHDTQTNHCHFLALVPSIETIWRLTKYGYFNTSVYDLCKVSPHPQVLAIFLLAAEGGHTAARLQSL